MLRFSFVESRRHGEVAVLAINDPPANALTYDLMLQLEDVFFELSLDPGVRAVVITGAGERFFSGGVNIGMLCSVSRHYNSNFILYAAEVFERIAKSRLQVVAAINGHITGGGLELALVADRRVAVDGNYNLGFPEVRLGVIPGLGGTQRLSRIIGPRRALELITHGEFLPPVRARELGVVDELLPREGFIERAVSYAHEMLKDSDAGVLGAQHHHPWQAPDPGLIRFERRGRIGLITLTENCATVSSLQALWALNQAILQARLDDSVEALLIIPAGHGLQLGAEGHHDEFVRDYADYVFQRLENFPRLCVLGFSGALDGLAAELALACDFRFARLVESAPDRVLMTVDGTSRRLARCGIAGAERANGGVIPLTQRKAVEDGLVRPLESSASPESVLEWLARFVSPHGASKSIGYAKFAIVQGESLPAEIGIVLERHLQEQLFSSHDGLEGMKAYLEKRVPIFRGK